MKTKYLLVFIIIPVVFVYASCKKEPIEDPHNHSLLNKTIDQIRSEITGKWQFKRGCGYGISGYVCNNNWPQNDFVYFLPGDTVKRELNGNVSLYAKAIITRYKNYPYTDSVYLFDINLFYKWVMNEIKNDTLVMDEPGSQSTYYLIRQ